MLSDDQQLAKDTIMQCLSRGETRMVLSGPAGSGKTTLMRDLIAEIKAVNRPVLLMAPTGKAASRLAALTGEQTTTIHRSLYKSVIEKESGAVEFADPQAVLSGKGVIVIDEASMVGSRLWHDLTVSLPRGVTVLCVGDREQLPPVQDTWGPSFDAPTALLTQVHRQAAESPIIQMATDIRTGGDWRETRPRPGYMRRRGTVEQAAAWLTGMRMVGADATLLTFSNQTRRRLNALVRQQAGRTEALESGDYIVVTRNSYPTGLCNGDVLEVTDCWPEAVSFWSQDDENGIIDLDCAQTDRGRILVRGDTLADGGTPDSWTRISDGMTKRDRNRLVRCEYGECLTVHKSQGSQWQSVGIVHDRILDSMSERDPETYRRLMYTAVTRAADNLVIFEV